MGSVDVKMKMKKENDANLIVVNGSNLHALGTKVCDGSLEILEIRVALVSNEGLVHGREGKLTIGKVVLRCACFEDGLFGRSDAKKRGEKGEEKGGSPLA